MIVHGFFDKLSVGEIAEVCSWFTYDNDRRLNNKHVLPNNLNTLRRELWHIIQHVHGIEERANVGFTPGIVQEFHGLALSWSRNMSLTGLLQRIELAEGDILMILNQTIDLVQQLQSAVAQVLNTPDSWEQISPVMIEDVDVDSSSTHARQSNQTSSRQQKQQEQLRLQQERLTHLSPILSQAAASLMHGIIVQSRTVPSMVALVNDEIVPLDAEEDRDAHDLQAPQTLATDI